MSKNEQQKNTQKLHNLNSQKQKNKNTPQNRLLKDRFLEAVARGELGCVENRGTVVTLKAFKAHFSDIKTDYINSFLPAATLQPGQLTASHTRYLFRVRKGAYLVHPGVLLVYWG